MYGGREGAGQYFDDVSVLSLPSFIWIQVYQNNSPRFSHTCHLVGSRTLLTVGGLESIEQIEKSPNNTDGLLPCDWEIKGVGVLNISSIHWGSAYDAEAPSHEVPTQVFSTIGGR